MVLIFQYEMAISYSNPNNNYFGTGTFAAPDRSPSAARSPTTARPAAARSYARNNDVFVDGNHIHGTSV